MNRRFFLYTLIIGFCTILTTFTLPTQVDAQGRHYGRDRDNDNDRGGDRDRYRDDDRARYERRYSRRQVQEIVKRVEESSNRFRKDLDRDLDRSRLDGSRREDKINDDVRRFEDAFDRLRKEFERRDSWWESRENVQQALDSARPVATRLRNNRFSSNVLNQWRALRADLNRLASTYNLPSV